MNDEPLPLNYAATPAAAGDTVLYHTKDGDVEASIMKFDPLSRATLATPTGVVMQVVQGTGVGQWSK